MFKRIALMMLTGSVLFTGCSQEDEGNHYTLKEATENGDTIVDEEGNVTNLNKLLTFVDMVGNKNEVEVTVSNFYNNQISINELKYDGNQVNYMVTSETGEETNSATCDGVEEKSGFISLQGCDGESAAIGLVQVSEYEINKVRASMKNQ
ncbi:hypothetical protein [Bacillus sp. KH172YL63]|uniref:hypothetical protein n=1 Tax=Bacillus sp. KH172YL63 TaxID=2709784 RepID=UPI0013E4CEE8|nr:hypothetical protein [Bacillus sp. KH172YL63]BCB04251.1 hypothetical protein KH172YL63_23840 [Bacillus sp. KH172YL63]